MATFRYKPFCFQLKKIIASETITDLLQFLYCLLFFNAANKQYTDPYMRIHLYLTYALNVINLQRTFSNVSFATEFNNDNNTMSSFKTFI